MMRYGLILMIGFSLTFLLQDSFFTQSHVIVNLFLRTLFACFFLCMIWLVQNIGFSNKQSK